MVSVSITYLFIEIRIAYSDEFSTFIYGLFVMCAAVSGGWLARYITWGWLCGSFAGLLVGFYTPMPVMYFMPTTSYEKVLPWLLLTGCIGLLVGGYGVDKLFKSCRKSSA